MTKRFSIILGFVFFVIGCCSLSLTRADNPVTYQVSIDVLWNSSTHGALPSDAHFSWFGGVTHNDRTSFWSEGELASPGMVRMAETGVTTLLLDEFAEEVSNGNAGSAINQNHWFCPAETTASQCGALSFDIQVDSNFPLVTLVSMLGPSPDWFVGVDSLSLIDNDQWVDQLVVELYPYDGGTRSANEFALFGPLNTPPEPIALITTGSEQIVTPQLIGRMTFTRVVPTTVGDFDGDGDVDCDDLDGYVGNLGATVTAELTPLDLDNDGTITLDDATTHITTLVQTSNGRVGTFFGDLNCDGEVNVLGDAFALIGNLSNSVTRYSQGDINFDGTVDVLGDAFILIGNLGFTNDPG